MKGIKLGASMFYSLSEASKESKPRNICGLVSVIVCDCIKCAIPLAYNNDKINLWNHYSIASCHFTFTREARKRTLRGHREWPATH